MKKQTQKHPKIIEVYYEGEQRIDVYEYVQPTRNQRTFNK